jgi:nitronate monooxygenase
LSVFLSCYEANISDDYKESLKLARDDDTRLTRAFSGRPARAKRNAYIESMAEHRSKLPDFPTMYRDSEPLEQASLVGQASGFDFTLYGQAAAPNREMGSADLVNLLVNETEDALKNFGR